MQKEVFSSKTKHVFEKIKNIEAIKKFYLAGGTGLALQLAHRKSIDLDFFSSSPILTKAIKNILKTLGKLEITSEDADTLNCTLDGVKLSFFEYPYRILFPFINGEGFNIADFRDIACMKIDAVSSRGSKKDFIDIYFILEKISLNEIFDLFDKKFKGIKYNRMHLLKSLDYFEEAEKDPMPVMLENIEWKKIKKEIQRNVEKYLSMHNLKPGLK